MGDTPEKQRAEDAGLQSAKPQAAARVPRYVWQRRWFQMLLAGLVIFAVLSFVVPGVLRALYAVRSVLVPVLIGLALAYVFNPVVTFAHVKLRLSRLATTISLMLLGLVVVAIIAVTAVPLAYTQGQSLIDTVQKTYPKYLDKVLNELEAAQGGAGAATQGSVDGERLVIDGEGLEESGDSDKPQAAEMGGGEVAGVDAGDSVGGSATEVAPPDEEVGLPEDTEEATWLSGILNRMVDSEKHRELLQLGAERLQTLDMKSVTNFLTQSLDVGVGLVGSAISFTTYLILSVIVAGFCFFFFSWRLNEIKAWFVPFIPASQRVRTLEVLHQMDLAVSAFVRGRLIQSVSMIFVLAIGWWIVDVPYWFLLAVLTGGMNLVPFLPMLGWLIALVLTVMTKSPEVGFSFGLLLWPSLVYFIAQGLDGWVVEPVVQGKATNLDALTVLLVVLVGGSVAGLLGLLLAIPTAACVKILSRELLLPKLRELAADG